MQAACIGTQQITYATLATAQTLAVPAGTERAWLQAVGGVLRFTLDGTTTPTASVGMVLPDSSAGGASPKYLELPSWLLANAKFIADSGTATLEVAYFGMT